MRHPWDTWRKLMVAGAVLLLINSIFNARQAVGDTDIAYVLANGVGYGLLASGFALAMRQRSALKKKREEERAAPGLLLAAEDEPEDRDRQDQHDGEDDERDAALSTGIDPAGARREESEGETR